MIPLDQLLDPAPDREEQECEQPTTGNVEAAYHNRLFGRLVRFEPEKEAMLLRLAQDGDADALEAIVVNFMPFVISIARRWSRGRGDVDEDLVSEGTIGLMSAVPLYDAEIGTRFSTYAKTRIMSVVRIAAMRNRSLVMIRPNQSSPGLFDNLNKAKERLGVVTVGGVSWTDAVRIAETLRSTPDKVQDMDGRMNLSEIAIENLDLMEVRLLNPLLEEIDIEGDLAEETLQIRMERVLGEVTKTLDDRERQIVRDRILAEEPMTLEECGAIYGVTRERIRQVETKIVSKMRRRVEGIDPMLAREMGSDVTMQIANEKLTRELTARVRTWGKGAKSRLIGNVVDEHGHLIARYPVELGDDNPAEAYIRGHAVGTGRAMIDEQGMSVQACEEGCRILEHQERIALEKDEKAARAWIDGFYAGHEWKSKRKPGRIAVHSWGTAPIGSADVTTATDEAVEAGSWTDAEGDEDAGIDADRNVETGIDAEPETGLEAAHAGIPKDQDDVVGIDDAACDAPTIPERTETASDQEEVRISASEPTDGIMDVAETPIEPMEPRRSPFPGSANGPAMRHRSARAVAGFMKWNAIKSPKKGPAGRIPRNEP
jgi:RNA polymerase sigma-32 factor